MGRAQEKSWPTLPPILTQTDKSSDKQKTTSSADKTTAAPADKNNCGLAGSVTRVERLGHDPHPSAGHAGACRVDGRTSHKQAPPSLVGMESFLKKTDAVLSNC